MSSFTYKETQFMERALCLAGAAKGKTSPNPAVGAVIVRNNTIIAEGATQHCGGPHAEIEALRYAGNRARGSTLYVSLEPCNHFGRTPPCTEQIVKSGIKKVVAACIDPNPLMSGKGIRRLRRSGIDVKTGLLRSEAERLNEDFFWCIKHNSPWITLKLALTLDGRIADSQGHSRWITNQKARRFVHQLRSRHAAVAVGRKTVEKDNPRLTVRHATGISPARIMFASSPPSMRTLNFINSAPRIRSIIVCPGKKKGDRLLRTDGAEVWYTGGKSAAQTLRAFLDLAYKEELTSILVEGGAKTAATFLDAGLVNRLYLFYGNCILGSGLHAFQMRKTLLMKTALHLNNMEILNFGDTIAVSGILDRRG